ncbi:tRNA1(Val) (adenine(37)-N6)-methyltransferase [Paracoccus sp. MC1862]|uniref:tRNA1(Val) (adenine(37)-N6)-methyltransferase n=1 Tax=Paracoccus sp. MC1862 TaxID=2760307 RepID=UPI001603FFA2|nr:methyltransferase [Paracoccus sp. MC1862]MBB1496705.1 methyltransferase [Paracoccus sp. MC1862]QQO43714.1 methyltransferase [Paracoccus sp. MC1862]
MTRDDAFLGGRLLLRQPARGYRAGADAVMLAAACPAQPVQRVLELGCGAGAALFCLGARVPGVALSGLERQEALAELALHNAAATGIAARIVTGDLAAMPAGLRAELFDHVIANPPFFAAGTRAPDDSRAHARHEDTPLEAWIDAGLRRLAPGGRLTLIHRAEALDRILAALSGRAGAAAILPVAPRQGREAGRVIVSACKGARGPLRLLSPFVLHGKPAHERDAEDLTPAAQAVLRHGAAIDIKPS